MKFWQTSVQEALAELDSNIAGISNTEASSRLFKFGKNEIQTERRRPAWRIFLSQFETPLILILLIAGAVSGFLGEFTSAIIIVVMILVSACLAFYQEYKSEKALNKLRRRISLQSTVRRNGKIENIAATDLVVGDIVIFEPGKIIPADLRLIDTKGLLIDESLLTGESYPVEKSSAEVATDKFNLQTLTNIAFMGTFVVQGTGSGVVFATGKKTELGRTAHLLEKAPQETEFQKGIREFGNLLVKVIFVFTAAIFLFLAILHGNWIDSLLFSLAVAVGISPELLPVIITINLSQGAKKMAARDVIIKRLMSIEDLGNMDVLCTDKTGTLTEGKIMLKSYHDLQDKEDPKILKYAWLCNAHTVAEQTVGNFLDQAIVDAGKLTNLDNKLKNIKTIDSVPFDFSRRRMSVVVEESGKRTLICKGAVEEMLAISKKTKSTVELSRRFKILHQQGFRLLAISTKTVKIKNQYRVADESNLNLVGYLVFIDMPKDTARIMLPRFAKLGVDLKIITGDNELAAQYICKEIGFKVTGVLLGADLEKLNKTEFINAVDKTNLFARVTPEQKINIVNALKAKGHTVGLLGDGINDAPALHAADVGISVDSAIDVAKEAADVVLLRKSLAVLTEGIIEGRKTFGNTIKYIISTISSNFGNMFSVVGASLILPFIPLLPTQVLLLNFFSDMPMLAVSTDRVDDDYLKKPKHWDVKAIRKIMSIFGLFSSIFDFTTFGVMLLIFNANQSLFQTGWFWESFLTEVVVIFILRTKKYFWQSRPSRTLLLACGITIILVLIVIYTSIGSYFNFTPLPLPILFTIVGITIVYFFVVEIAKKYFYQLQNQKI